MRLGSNTFRFYLINLPAVTLNLFLNEADLILGETKTAAIYSKSAATVSILEFFVAIY